MNISSFFVFATAGTVLLSASEANAQTCGWSSLQPLPNARHLPKSATVDGKLYVLGGQSLGGAEDRVDVYDPVAGTWEAREPMPDAPVTFGLAAIDRTLFRVGGIAANAVVDDVQAYDVDSDTWAALAPMPVKAAYMTATALDGKIYAVGGINLTAENEELVLSAVHRYDPETDTWTAVAPLPRPRAAHDTAAVNGKLYVVGGVDNGVDGSVMLDGVSAYDPVTDTWAEVAPLPTPRAHMAVAALGGQLYVAGGVDTTYDVSEGITGRLDRYDAATNSWAPMPSLLTARTHLAASFVRDRLYLVGGASVDVENSAVTLISAFESLPVLAKAGLLTRTTAEAAGDHCPAGGTRLDTGFDTNCNGELDNGDTMETVYLCHGEDGASAHEVIVESKDEPSGDNCPNGGVRVDAGYDTNGDGELSSEEVTKTTYICHGAKGPGGAPGSGGVDGVDGRDGEAGSEGGCSVVHGGGARNGSLLAVGLSALALFGWRRRHAGRA